jgi:hypothetical protein
VQFAVFTLEKSENIGENTLMLFGWCLLAARSHDITKTLPMSLQLSNLIGFEK